MPFDYDTDKKIQLNQERLKLDLASVDDLNKSTRLYWAIAAVLFGVSVPLIESNWSRIFDERDIRYILLIGLMSISVIAFSVNFFLFGVLKIEYQIDHLPKDIYGDPDYSPEQYLKNLEEAVNHNHNELNRKSRHERNLGVSLIVALFFVSLAYLGNQILI